MLLQNAPRIQQGTSKGHLGSVKPKYVEFQKSGSGYGFINDYGRRLAAHQMYLRKVSPPMAVDPTQVAEHRSAGLVMHH